MSYLYGLRDYRGEKVNKAYYEEKFWQEADFAAKFRRAASDVLDSMKDMFWKAVYHPVEAKRYRNWLFHAFTGIAYGLYFNRWQRQHWAVRMVNMLVPLVARVPATLAWRLMRVGFHFLCNLRANIKAGLLRFIWWVSKDRGLLAEIFSDLPHFPGPPPPPGVPRNRVVRLLKGLVRYLPGRLYYRGEIPARYQAQFFRILRALGMRGRRRPGELPRFIPAPFGLFGGRGQEVAGEDGVTVEHVPLRGAAAVPVVFEPAVQPAAVGGVDPAGLARLQARIGAPGGVVAAAPMIHLPDAQVNNGAGPIFFRGGSG